MYARGLTYAWLCCCLQENLHTELAERDWGVQQVLTSANWGGVIGNFFTGGLNLQIEHHLFPAISFMHYPAIAAIVADECKKRGINVSAIGWTVCLLLSWLGLCLLVPAVPVVLCSHISSTLWLRALRSCACHAAAPGWLTALLGMAEYLVLLLVVNPVCTLFVCVLQYAHYDTLPEILGRFMRYMKEAGEAEQQPATGAAAAQLARL